MNGIADASSTRKRRRWYRFSLRSLFVLTLLAAVAFAYHAHRLRRYELQQRAEDTIGSMGGQVYISPEPATWWQRLAGPAYTTYGETEVAFTFGPWATQNSRCSEDIFRIFRNSCDSYSPMNSVTAPRRRSGSGIMTWAVTLSICVTSLRLPIRKSPIEDLPT